MEIAPYLRQTLCAQYGEAEAERIVRGYGCTRAVTLRVNRLRTTAQEVCESLADAGIAVERVPWSEDALCLPDAREDALTALPLYAQGMIYLQSLSSMIPALVLDAQPGECVLDMAAAPGGKTTQIAALTGNGAQITACEKDAARAERLRFNLARQGATRVTVMQTDARMLSDLFAFDRVLLDAPCSGSGTVSEGSRGRFAPTYLQRTTKWQAALMDKALTLLKPGHTMVYSTCSVLEAENEAIVRRALRRGAVLEPIDAAAFADVPTLPTSLPGTLLVCPDARYEGFFVAKLRKGKR